MSSPHRVGDRYELEGLLGRGGMAEVRKGTDVRLGRTVAVKRLRTDLASDPTFQARFRREAQSAASLNHPAIVSVYDTGEEWSEGSDGNPVSQPYIVMEYVAGRTLRDILREGRKILPERAMEITSGVLGALDYSHRAGIIHRDIKPGNVMLTPAGDVKVMDFGIARALSDSQNTMTQTAAVVGTAQYLSPEQARGEAVDSRSDVYSTGCLLYELLTGRPPFVGDTPVAVAYQHVRENPLPPSTYDDEIPPAIDAIVMKSLAKPLGQRYQSAAAMKADIDRWLAGQPVEAPAAAVPPPPVNADDATAMIAAQGPPTGTILAAADTDDDRPRHRGAWIGIGLLLLALIGAGAYFVPKLLNDKPQTVTVPSLAGMTRAEARQALSAKGLKADFTEQNNDTVAAGKVADQDPQAGDTANVGDTVNVVLSLGKAQVTVPDLTGMKKKVAAATLQGLGLTPDFVYKDSDLDRNVVLSTDPPATQQVPANSSVTVYLSNGPAKVPDVIGKTEDEARQLITAAGFKVSVVYDDTSTKPKGTVVDQSPAGGTPENQGYVVQLVISRYEPTTSPSPSPSATTTPPPTSP